MMYICASCSLLVMRHQHCAWCTSLRMTPCAPAPGVGKTAIVEGLAQRIVNGDVPSTLRPMRVISLDMSALVAGTKYRGEFEERIQNVLKEVTEAKNIILFIDEIHLVRAAALDYLSPWHLPPSHPGSTARPALHKQELCPSLGADLGWPVGRRCWARARRRARWTRPTC